MTTKRRKKLPDRQRAKLLLDAQDYRRRYGAKDDEPFNPLRHIEHDMLLTKPHCVYGYEKELVEDDGTENDGQVVFDRFPFLQVTDEVAMGAYEALQPFDINKGPKDGSALMTLCHEIAHVVLHTNKMKTRVGQALKRGLPSKCTSFRTDPIEEEEANVFGGGLLAPVDVITPHTRAKDLKLRYRMSLQAAQELIDQVRELAPLLAELRLARSPKKIRLHSGFGGER